MKSKRQTAQADDFPRGIGQPARRALHGAGYRQLDQLAGVEVTDIAYLHGIGPKAIQVLREALAEKGLTFGGEENAS